MITFQNGTLVEYFIDETIKNSWRAFGYKTDPKLISRRFILDGRWPIQYQFKEGDTLLFLDMVNDKDSEGRLTFYRFLFDNKIIELNTLSDYHGEFLTRLRPVNE